jgi:two-component system phosphate regulon response regulator PhoB
MNRIEFETLIVDLDKKECSLDGKEVSLTKTEYNLLVFLLNNRNKVYTRREIMQNVWDTEVSLRAVDTTVSRLRKKIGQVGKHIVTKLGFGYGFNE